MVHAAAAYARMKNRLGGWVCTSSIGPGATNMITGAALATINHLPVLLLPGDIFARRNVAPVLQQLESDCTQEISVNDCFRPVSRYWDRINRPDQLLYALPEVMRVLTSPAQTGAVTLALPQDVQTEAWDYPVGFFEPRVWHIPRARPDAGVVKHAAELIAGAERPMIVCGGGVIYSAAGGSLSALVEASGIPIGETQAGKGALTWDQPENLGGVGVTGTLAANRWARDADVIIGVGTRYSDFTTASKTAFQNPRVRFININVAEIDAAKHGGVSMVGDARVCLDELRVALGGYRVSAAAAGEVSELRTHWQEEVDRIYSLGHGPLASQGEIIGVLNETLAPEDVIINAAGSGPGDLHKLWRASGPGTYHVEYGYSCMGYEIPAALGVKIAAPEREVVALVGDGTYLMMPTELSTAVQEGIKIIVVVVDNHGFASIGGLSESVGSGGFGTHLRGREGDEHTGDSLPVDFEANARSLGARAVRVESVAALREALVAARSGSETTVIVIESDREERVGGYDSWWDVAVAEVSEMDSVRAERAAYDEARARERDYHAEKPT